MAVVPPTYGAAPPFVCGRVVKDKPFTLCSQPALYHVLWTKDGEQSLLCGVHYHEARNRWSFVAMHAYVDHLCSFPLAQFDVGAGRCRVENVLLADLDGGRQ